MCHPLYQTLYQTWIFELNLVPDHVPDIIKLSLIFAGVSDDDAAFVDAILGRPSTSCSSGSKLPPRPPTSSSKSPRPYTPNMDPHSSHHQHTSIGVHHGAKSPSTSGHHSAGSKFSVSSPSASPSSLGKLSPGPDYCVTPYSSKGSSTNFTKSEEAITKLRKEITSLRERFANRQKDWAEVSKLSLMSVVVPFG